MFFKFVCKHHDNDSHLPIMESIMKRGGGSSLEISTGAIKLNLKFRRERSSKLTHYNPISKERFNLFLQLSTTCTTDSQDKGNQVTKLNTCTQKLYVNFYRLVCRTFIYHPSYSCLLSTYSSVSGRLQ